MAIQGSAVINIGKTLTSITVSPTTVTLQPGQSQQFTATAHYNDSSTAPASVTWTAGGGTITPAGLYTAGSTTGNFTVVAHDTNSTITGTASVTVPSSNLLWNATMEGGVWPSGKILQQCVSGRISIYNSSTAPAGAPAPRVGSYAAAFRVLNTDVSPCTPTENPRAQVLSTDFVKPGMELWEEFSVFFPTSYPTPGSWFLFQEDYGPPFQSTPPSAWYIQSFSGQAHMYLSGNYNQANKSVQTLWHAPLIRNQWNVIKHHKLYKTTTDGFVEAFVNGTRVTPLQNMQTMMVGSTSWTVDLNQYRALNCYPNPGDVTIYFDHWRVGLSEADVSSM